MTVRFAKSVVWDHGDETFQKDGTTRQVSHLRGFNGALPRGMFCTMTTVWGEKSREESVEVTIQARAPGGRRHTSYRTVHEATQAVVKWAQRVLREREWEREHGAYYYTRKSRGL